MADLLQFNVFVSAWLLDCSVRFNSHHEWSVLQSSIYSPLLLTLLHWVFSLSSENLILLVKGPSSPLNSLLDIENVDLNMIISIETYFRECCRAPQFRHQYWNKYKIFELSHIKNLIRVFSFAKQAWNIMKQVSFMSEPLWQKGWPVRQDLFLYRQAFIDS